MVCAAIKFFKVCAVLIAFCVQKTQTHQHQGKKIRKFIRFQAYYPLCYW